MWLAVVFICAKSKHRFLATNVIVVPSCSVSCGSPAASGCMHPSALTVKAGRLILFLPFGAGLTPLFSGSNINQNILYGSCRFEGKRENKMVRGGGGEGSG